MIEKLVHPAYPEHAYDHNIEGRVLVMALVDTTGKVVDVQVAAADPAMLHEFGEAASEAGRGKDREALGARGRAGRS